MKTKLKNPKPIFFEIVLESNLDKINDSVKLLLINLFKFPYYVFILLGQIIIYSITYIKYKFFNKE